MSDAVELYYHSFVTLNLQLLVQWWRKLYNTFDRDLLKEAKS